MEYNIKDIELAEKGKLKIEWAEKRMPVLREIRKRFRKEKPFENLKISACLHVTTETANLMITLKEGGADIKLTAANPLSTKDDVAAALVKYWGIPVFAKAGESKEEYYQNLRYAVSHHPNITMDDGADLITLIHTEEKNLARNILGGTEETTTGVIRLKAMEKEGVLLYPVIAVNESYTKYLFDNRYGTGQSTIDGILRATNILLAGKTVVVVGYGWCGRGVAMRARGMGARVIICEVSPIKALEAVMDGYQVMPIEKAAEIGDLFITITGNKSVIRKEHFLKMKDGAILANTGHFNVEIDIKGLEEITKKKRKIREFVEEYTLENGKKIYLLAEGRVVNLSAGEGHPAEVMDMSFSNQALAVEYIVKNKGKLEKKVYKIPDEIDINIAKLKLQTMGIKIDELTEEQKKYLQTWREGTQ